MTGFAIWYKPRTDLTGFQSSYRCRPAAPRCQRQELEEPVQRLLGTGGSPISWAGPRTRASCSRAKRTDNLPRHESHQPPPANASAHCMNSSWRWITSAAAGHDHGRRARPDVRACRDEVLPPSTTEVHHPALFEERMAKTTPPTTASTSSTPTSGASRRARCAAPSSKENAMKLLHALASASRAWWRCGSIFRSATPAQLQSLDRLLSYWLLYFAAGGGGEGTRTWRQRCGRYADGRHPVRRTGPGGGITALVVLVAPWSSRWWPWPTSPCWFTPPPPSWRCIVLRLGRRSTPASASSR